MQDNFKCLMIRGSEQGSSDVTRKLEMIGMDDLPAGEVVVQTHYSSLNYKDALAATGHRGIIKHLPHIPGIDAAGVVVSSDDPFFKVGDEVMVFHGRLGTESFGGYSQFLRVPTDWVYALPANFSMRQAMVYGTAGFTAAQSIIELMQHQVTGDRGDVVVTGATGGVGSMAVAMLAKLGYSVVAVSGKADKVDWLKELGAKDVIPREEMDDKSSRPLLKSRWTGAVDTVGGNTLATILRSTALGACVTACGLVGGTDLRLTVYPFILRGVTLQGIDSANIDYETRDSIWKRLAREFALPDVDVIAREVALEDLESSITGMLKGEIAGRVIVNCQ